MKNFLRKSVATLLGFLARMIVRKYRPKIVAVTGNVGKTSTKDAIFSVLEIGRHVRKSEKSFNSEFGIPLAIIGAHNPWWNIFKWFSVFSRAISLLVFKHEYPVWLVLEVGADRPGDIKRVASWLRPHIVVVTRFADVPVHVEYFSSRDALIAEKQHLVRVLQENGLLIVNRDDPDAYAMRKLFSGQVISYGFSEGSSVQADYCKPLIDEHGKPLGVTFKVAYDNHTIEVKLYGTLGFGQAYAALPALTVGAASTIQVEDMLDALSKYVSPPGRMRLLEGIKKTLIIDDSCNSSPIATENALAALEELPCTGRKICVLGDMLELGKHSAEEHKRVGAGVAKVADMLLIVGLRARGIAEGALDNGMSENVITQYDTAREAGGELGHLLLEGDIVLVKGSQAMRTERVVEEIMAHPERKEELLVRQDPEWLKKM